MRIICVCFICLLVAENFFLFRVLKHRNSLLQQSDCRTEKFRLQFELAVEWLIGEMDGKNIAEWILRKDYRTIAIYGLGPLGVLLFRNLCANESLHVEYGIDRNKKKKIEGLNVYNLNDHLEPVDLIVVTVIFSYEEIESEIIKKVEFPCVVMSLMQLVEKMYIESEK